MTAIHADAPPLTLSTVLFSCGFMWIVWLVSFGPPRWAGRARQRIENEVRWAFWRVEGRLRQSFRRRRGLERTPLPHCLPVDLSGAPLTDGPQDALLGTRGQKSGRTSSCGILARW